MLQFIGTGSAFNTKLGNNSAFYKKGDTLFLIDCGSNIFTRIEEANLLEGINHIYVLITHTHPDHIGSLGDLIFYGYYSMGVMFKPSVTVIAPRDLGITNILNHVGVKPTLYNVHEFTGTTNINKDNIRVNIIAHKVNHVEELPCYGYEIRYYNESIYYSGDTNHINIEALHKLYSGDIDHFYQDTSKADYNGNVHLSLRILNESIVLDEFRSKIYCMHLDNNFDVKEAEDLGFNVVKSILDVDKSQK